MPDIFVSIGLGALGGIVYGIAGFFKNKKQEAIFEGFDYEAFLTTVGGAAVFGGISGFTGIASSELAAGMYGTLITQFIKKLIGMFRKK